jgi:hypothetical protein
MDAEDPQVGLPEWRHPARARVLIVRVVRGPTNRQRAHGRAVGAWVAPTHCCSAAPSVKCRGWRGARAGRVTDTYGASLLSVMGAFAAFAAFERTLIRERLREGITSSCWSCS